ncbi:MULTISPECIES: Hsp70 family protein [Pontibacillus]|uniref:Chaperone protein DnaK n=1 Tax=Pontibacillus chungwhensis TaxID=265426 RepID=A0ABY8UYE8_9BACI|nr:MULTISPECIES: Hsp70 family protein [Pontibacillus]MCD5324155.1 Hsp70 family protein [Pontibacillus sp. HN14]WIF97786.1 Hsp70 family protein [Pontibacillus chungwhensis]
MAMIGIDLGTTNSAMAFLKNGQPEIITNSNGGRTTPSVFQIDAKGEIKVGPIAKKEYPSFPKETVLEVKRSMGEDKTLSVGDKEYRPEEVSAHILKYLKSSAEEQLGEPVNEAVVTVPAYFSDSQRKATQKAGELAGLKVERIINEPTSAAIAYGLDHMDKDQNILIYDLGGGTFDVSLVEIFSGVVEIKATAGDNHLGGMDFDQLIFDWIIDEVKKEEGVDLLAIGDEQVKARIKAEAENVKIALSSQSTVAINLPFIAIHNNAPISINLEMSRAKFEKMVKPLVTKTIEKVDQVLNDSSFGMANIDEVLLIGGSTRIPLVVEMVSEKFGKKPKKDINPDEAVALGAAVQGGIKSGEISSESGLMVIDSCPFALGTEVVREIGGQFVSGYFDPIIPKNSTVPITKSKTYYTVRDNQTEVQISVYQGENEDQYTSQNNLLSDDIVLSGIPPRPAGEEMIEVQFSYDINGNVQVEGTILSTGKKVEDIVRTQTGVMSDQSVAESKAKLSSEWKQSDMYEEVRHVINRAEKVVDEVEADEQKRIEDLLYKLKQALKENNVTLVKRYEEELTDMLIELV